MGLNGNKHPWYKERLRTKYSKDVNPILNHKNWTYIKSGLDDFRDGMPPDAAQGSYLNLVKIHLSPPKNSVNLSTYVNILANANTASIFATSDG